MGARACRPAADICCEHLLLLTWPGLPPRNQPPLLLQLVALVKHWAKQRAVNDAYRGTLSSYCYVLMAIYHMQASSPGCCACLLLWSLHGVLLRSVLRCASGGLSAYL